MGNNFAANKAGKMELMQAIVNTGQVFWKLNKQLKKSLCVALEFQFISGVITSAYWSPEIGFKPYFFAVGLQPKGTSKRIWFESFGNVIGFVR